MAGVLLLLMVLVLVLVCWRRCWSVICEEGGHRAKRAVVSCELARRGLGRHKVSKQKAAQGH
jgi:hypothetical protein